MAKAKSWADSKTAWKKRAGPHNVTLASGQKVTLRVFGPGELILRDAMPDMRDVVTLAVLKDLQLDAAVGIAKSALELATNGDEAEQRQKFQERLRAEHQRNKLLVSRALVEPQLTPEELDEVPWEDVEELVRICTGKQAFDARGVRVGVERIDSWATFQGWHRDGPCLGEDCPRCAGALGDLSSLHMVQV